MATDEVRNSFASGRAYCDAAKLVATHDQSDGRDYLVLPTHTLLGVSIETLYKTILLDKGVGHNEVSSFALRHNLKALRDRAEVEGFISASKVDEIIDHIGEPYGKHEYRYMKPNSKSNTVNVNAAVAAVDELIEEVRRAVGLPQN